ncbi:FlgB family protein [Aliiroseovarius sp.]|uniref:FlgB family protein n=1 Tax=Aliiroseovarius sp. TaxID=1872442 RepID=UPI0026161834|nr:FlgB family protein [Aliiroseovarius sp.]
MFDKLEIFRMSQGLAMHAAKRQSTIAQNVANADTPGYRARDIASFAETYAPLATDGMRATRAGHLNVTSGPHEVAQAREALRPGAVSPNGNTVSLETEVMASASAKGDYDLALGVYQSSLRIMRASLGKQ